ncbi:hypothetical protein KCP74_16345 [Salmonella enterica subsp. enterica]|nr:hypothetical protein KCP74_16345 [Salmonella enterica subsp. enterica]
MVMYVTFSSSAPVCACSSLIIIRAPSRVTVSHISKLRNGNLLIIRNVLTDFSIKASISGQQTTKSAPCKRLRLMDAMNNHAREATSEVILACVSRSAISNGGSDELSGLSEATTAASAAQVALPKARRIMLRKKRIFL